MTHASLLSTAEQARRLARAAAPDLVELLEDIARQCELEALAAEPQNAQSDDAIAS
jgi:hypothetical protein